MQEEAITGEIDRYISNYKDDPFLNWWHDLKWDDDFQKIEVEPCSLIAVCLNYYLSNTFLYAKDLAKNSYQGEQCILKFPSGEILKVFKGMKPMKILAKFVKEFNGPADAFEAFRIWHSKQLGQRRIDGELCLSIHPLDFMTMSDNSNDWTSCMRWRPLKNTPLHAHGDYRGGTVSCMNSPYIIMAYLHNPDHKYKIDEDWVWNSKRWRELFIVQEGIITEIKGYCFQDENLTNTSLMWIKELAKQNLNWEYNNEEINVISDLTPEDNERSVLLTFTPGTFMYKDMGTLPIHRGRVNFEKLLDTKLYDIEDGPAYGKNKMTTFVNIPYGGEATCMCCGKLRYTDEEIEGLENSVFCTDCEEIPRCAHCGSPLYSNNEMYYVDEYDSAICEACWEDESAFDSFAYDDAHLISNMTEISLLLGFDAEEKPVFYDYTAMCYEPEYNSSYLELFYNPPTIGYHRTYATITEIRPGHENDIVDIFGMDRKAVKDGNFDKLLLDYDVVRYPEDPIIPEDEDNLEIS